MPGTEVDDADLGARVRSGDDDAFAVLYQRFLPRLYDFAARLLRDPAAAEDLVQSTFIRAYEHRDSLRDPAKVKSWLFTTAHNLALNQLERRRPAEPVEERWDLAAPGPGPEAEAETQEAADLVWSAAAGLEARQYAVLDMSVRQELTTAEIAEVLGLPAGHAAVLVNRAREALGNAVRFLMVARRRDHCSALAELVPAGVRALSPEQRSSVDYHMRRCEDCQVMARRLTAPAELFGELLPVPVPANLMPWRGWTAQSASPGGAPASRRPRSGSGLLHAITSVPALTMIAVAVIAAGAGGMAWILHNENRSLGTPARTPGSAASTPAPGCGPYTTPQSAEGQVTSQLARTYPSGPNPLSWAFPDVDMTWRRSATLHVLHATPTGGATGATGEWFFFFVNGCSVGKQVFLANTSDAAVDDSTFEVTYSVYRPGDVDAAPSGGSTTVRFHWNGARLEPTPPIPGAVPS